MAPINPQSRPSGHRGPSTSARNATADNFELDNEMDAFFGSLNNQDEQTTQQDRTADSSKTAANGTSGEGFRSRINIDAEVKVRKARDPAPKLDEDRLLSAKGIPKLRKISKERLRFKGKGHEFSDMAKLLNMYQFWLDDLFPRAKFLDALSMVEKVGHSRRMTVMRKQWIDEGKPRPGSGGEDDDAGGDVEDIGGANEKDVSETAEVPRESETADQGDAQSPVLPPPQGPSNDVPDDDEMDALMAEAEMEGEAEHTSLFGPGPPAATSTQKPAEEENFFDDEDDLW